MSRASRDDLAAGVWRRLFDLLLHSAPERSRALGRLGLTPNDSRALSELDAKDGRSMQSLARRWSCDASNVTLIVDRLERLGLAARRPAPGDRRVKHVILTPRGVQTRNRLRAAMYRPPAEIASLDRQALAALATALEAIGKQDG